MRSWHLRFATVLLCVLIAAPCVAQVVVEAVEASGAGATAGIRVGDRLLSWQRVRAGSVSEHGSFGHPLDARDFEIEQLPRGGTRITLERLGRRLVVSPGLGEWGIATGLALHGALRARYATGLAQARAKDIDGAATTWQGVAVELALDGHIAEAIWLRSRIGRHVIGPVSTGFFKNNAEEGRHVDWADAEFAEAIVLARRIADPRLEAFVQEAAGAAWGIDVLEPWRASLGRIRKNFGESLRLRLAVAPASLTVAASMHSLAASWAWSDDPREPPDYDRAIGLYDQAIALRSRLAPGSHDEGLSRLMLALLLFERGHERAGAEIRTAAAILQRTAPGSHALELSALVGSLLAGDAGDYDQAVSLYKLGLPIARRRPDFQRSGLMNDRSLILLAGGHFAAADAALRRHLVMTGTPPTFVRRLDPPSGESGARDLNLYVMLGFGRYAAELGNDRTAATFLRLAANAAERALGSTVAGRDDLLDVRCTARARLITVGQETPEDLEGFDANCVDQLRSARGRDPYGEYLLLLSQVELLRGRASPAIELAATAVGLRRKIGAPQWLASALRFEGEALCASGRTTQGISTLDQASQIYVRLAPRDRQRVETLAALGICQRRAGRLVEASGHLRAAMLLAEKSLNADPKQSDQSRALGAAALSRVHEQLVGVLLDLGRPFEAFNVAERGRARAFRKMIAERRLTEGGPKWALELHQARLRRRERVWASYDEAQRRVDESPADDSSERDRRVARLHAIALQLDATEADNRAKTPFPGRTEGRAAGLNPSSFDETIAALAPGTVLIEYVVGPTTTRAFVLGTLGAGRQLVAKTLAIGEPGLRNLIDRFNASLGQPLRGDLHTVEAPAIELYDTLVRPIENLVARHARVVIVPDGPLHSLPFCALVRASGDQRQYFVEWKPIHIAPSATGYVLLRGMPHADPNGAVVAVGDPTRQAPNRGAQATRGAIETENVPEVDETGEAASDLGRALPGSRREVLSVARIMGPGVTTLLGRDASESRVKSLPESTRVLHLATHATINNALTANSGLSLTRPSTAVQADNGYLQVWEIVDQLRLRADLVTLSACDSAIGRTFAGEGVMSLARAFHYAGARSVVSTLWRIDDSATADLMTAFYAGLKAGLSKDEALRRAQIGFIHPASGASEWRHPAYWAAFQLSGDWQ